MRRLSEWTRTEGFAFAAATAVLALISGLGAFVAGRVWIDRYISEHERSGPVSTLPEPSGKTAGGGPTPGNLSPRVVIREREPTEAERRALAEENSQPAARETAAPSPSEEAAAQPAGGAGISGDSRNDTEVGDTAKPTASEVQPSPRSGGSWTATAGSYREPRNAEQVAEALRAQGFDVEIEPVTVRGQTFYRVRAGTFAAKAEAEDAARKIQAAGYPSQVLAEP